MEKKIVYSKETIKMELMTPEKAEKLLKSNFNNRKINRRNVIKYKNAILNNEYNTTGDCILIDKYGDLLNGQHRLTAIVEANIPVVVDIKYGVNPDVKYVQNTGRATSQNDLGDIHLKPFGIHSKMYPAISKTLDYFEHNGSFSKSKLEYHPKKIIEFSIDEKHIDMIKSIGATHASKKRNPFGNASLALTKEVIFSLIDKSKAEIFFNSFYEHDFGKGDPIHALWMWVENRKNTNKNARWGAAGEEELNVAINIAWNAFVQGKKLNQIRLYENDKLRKVEALDINNNLQAYFQN